MQTLVPSIVWSHFATLCEIPRPSYREAALKRHLVAWAQGRGLAVSEDAAGNLILKKPASPGCEDAPGVVLQGHLDMVCQANAGTAHDFERDAIRPVVRDGWVIAEETTLGADNGIGVALALAALEAPDLKHPALEVLLTVNEESGMDGARGLLPGTLQGRFLINLDTEEWGHFYLGCAGGVDVEVHAALSQQEVPADFAVVQLTISGLRGGHSGIDIHLGRGNALKLLAEALRDWSSHTDLRLITMRGGTARNAIPREAVAVFAIPALAISGLQDWVEHRLHSWRQRFAATDAEVRLQYELHETGEARAITNDWRDRVLAFFDSVPNGVAAMSADFPGVTDTSSNLGVLALQAGRLDATFKVRSLHDGRADALADKLLACAAGYGLQAHKDGAYPGWTPNPASPLLRLCQEVYAAQWGAPASLQVIHAGLECGLLADSHPQLDMISFGPDIRGAHAPGERVEIVSVARCWQLLRGVLGRLAEHHA
ncbi:MAG: aminoacyl-histidine dipeptidase [Sideroxydans sp.]